MAEWQEFLGPALGSAPGGRAPAPPPPLVPTLEDHGEVVLEEGEIRIGVLPTTGVRFRSRIGNVDQRWGPLDMRMVVTTHRIVLIATPGTPHDAPWSTPGSVPIALRAMEPPQELRGLAPVRIAGHVRWSRVKRIQTEGSRIFVTMPGSLGTDASLTLHMPSQLGHRLVAIARGAFITAKRPLSTDTPTLVEAPLAD